MKVTAGQVWCWRCDQLVDEKHDHRCRHGAWCAARGVAGIRCHECEAEINEDRRGDIGTSMRADALRRRRVRPCEHCRKALRALARALHPDRARLRELHRDRFICDEGEILAWSVLAARRAAKAVWLSCENVQKYQPQRGGA